MVMGRKLFRKLGLGGALAAGVATAAALGAAPAPAHACGGLFCSSTNPVNQAAEQIIFVDNPDGSVTAVIQILYEGPAHQFAWVLPVPGNPTVGVSSEQAFASVKGLTNPQYNLQRRFADGCATFMNGGPQAPSASGAGGSAAEDDGGVSVVASGAIGPYEYDTIAVDPTADDPADVAIKWLADNGYDVGALGPDVLRPYLEEGLNLIAFKLDKNSSTGSIRPVMLTYESEHPSIPIRPTAVAANDDMGVMVFLLSSERGIPQNYKALELNEALINWFNASSNYNEIVSLAADEAMGQGFVTEFAGPHANLSGFQGPLQIFPDFQRQNWQAFQAAPHGDAMQMIQDASNNWGSWDGFDDALRAAVTLPQDIAYADFKNCTQCYLSEPGVVFSNTTFLRQLYEMVIKPMQETQALFDSRPYLTRLYTTMSAEEMTMDPVFAFNPDLEDVSNIHTATQLIECNATTSPFGPDVPWSVDLPQGGTVRGAGQGTWPIDVTSQPAAVRIMQFGTSGDGEVVEDLTTAIADMNDPAPGKPTAPVAGSGAMASAGSGGIVKNPPKPSPGGSGGTGGSAANPDANDDEPKGEDDGGCSVAGARGSDALSLLLLAAIPLIRRRRR
jgi:MYXO-CTERM domain-containing protein